MRGACCQTASVNSPSTRIAPVEAIGVAGTRTGPSVGPAIASKHRSSAGIEHRLRRCWGGRGLQTASSYQLPAASCQLPAKEETEIGAGTWKLEAIQRRTA